MRVSLATTLLILNQYCLNRENKPIFQGALWYSKFTYYREELHTYDVFFKRQVINEQIENLSHICLCVFLCNIKFYIYIFLL